VEILRTEK